MSSALHPTEGAVPGVGPEGDLVVCTELWKTAASGPASVAGQRAACWNAVRERLQRAIQFERGAWEPVGIRQRWFDDLAQAQAAGAALDAASARERLFARQVDVVTPPPPASRGGLTKRLSLITRQPRMSEADFLREWRVHADHVRGMPGVVGYRQNLVLARSLAGSGPCGYEALPIDGVVEFWFRDTPAIDAAFGSPQGLATMRHAASFLSQITVFIVTESCNGPRLSS